MTGTGRPLTRLEVMRALKWANWDAALYTVFLALSGGAFQTGFARHLGATDLWLGIMTALPSLTGGLQLLAAYVGQHTPNRRQLVLRAALLGRLPWLFVAVLPLLALGGAGLPIFVGMLTLSAILSSFAGPAYLAWLSDLVPPDYRGRYFGRRNMILGIVTAAAALPPAIFLDQAVKYHRFSPNVAFAVLFGLGVACTFASWIAATRLPEVTRELPPKGGWHDFLHFYRRPLQDRTFRRMMIFFAFWTAGQLFAGQFFTVYMLENLRMPYTLIQTMTLIASLSNSLGVPLWGYLSDKFGNKPLLIISGTGVVASPLFWILATPENFGWSIGVIVYIQITSGFLWGGVALSSFNLILGVAPEDQRTIYMGTVSAIGVTVGGVAPFLGGLMMEFMQPHLTNEMRFQVLFGTTAFLRAFALLWLRGLKEPRGVPAAYVLSQLRSSARPRSWLALRRLSRGQDEESRVEAARSLAEAPTPLAVEELVQALRDPSPEVRRQAVIALGETGDARAIEPLLEAARDPASDVTLEALDALGKIGQDGILPDLIDLLDDRRVLVRMAAVRAIEQIGSTDALPLLFERLPAGDSPDELAMVLRTISILLGGAEPDQWQELRASEKVLPLIESDAPDVRAAAADVLSRLSPEPIAPLLRLRLGVETNDSAMASLASALAVHGTQEETEGLIHALARCESPLAQRQIALALAQLWGARDRLYALLTAEEINRDQLVSKALEPFIRENPAISDALRMYTYGDYGIALQTLAQALPDNRLLQHLYHAPSLLESWLLAVAGI